MADDEHKDPCCECGVTGKDVILIQMKVPGTTNTYDPKDRRRVCKRCRKKRGYIGRFRECW